MKKRVYLFSCIEKNIGDDLFVYATCNRYPYIDFITSIDAEYLKRTDIGNLKYSKKMKLWLKYANNESRFFMKRLYASHKEKKIRKSMEKLDSIYIVGNAFKNMNYRGSYQIQWLKRRVLLSNRFFLLSTNYGPSNNDKKWVRNCKNVFRKMSDVCFRDTASIDLFKDLPNTRYAPDAVLTLDKNIIGRFLHSKSQLTLPKKYIVISVIDCAMNGRSQKLRDATSNYEDTITSIINDINEDNIEVIILNSNTKQDRPAANRIYNKCKNKNRVTIYDYAGNLWDVFSIFESAEAIIATRLHTIILGWIYNKPVLPLIYDMKIKNLLKSYNFTELQKDITNLNGLDYSIIKKSIDNYHFSLSPDLINHANLQYQFTDKLLKNEEASIEN